jgi:hypothetical protein
LFGPGGALFRQPGPKSFLGDHPLVVYAPGVDHDAFVAVFWPRYRHVRAWPELIEVLGDCVPGGGTIGVVPCAPLQLAADDEADMDGRDGDFPTVGRP